MMITMIVTINESQTVRSNLSVGQLVTYNWIAISMFVTPTLIVNTFAAIMLITETSLLKVFRLVLLCIIASCIFVGLRGLLICLANFIAIYQDIPGSMTACRFFGWMILAGMAGRTSFMAMLAIEVYVLVKHGQMALKMKTTVIGIFAICIVIGSFSLITFSNNAVQVSFIGGVICNAGLQSSITGYICIFIYVSIFGILPFIILIFTSCASWHKLKQAVVSSDTKSKQALVKFGLFLLIGNTINLIGQVLPIATSSSVTSNDPHGKLISLYWRFILAYISLLPSPILVILYFKPIRRKVFHCLTYCCRKTVISINSIKSTHVITDSEVENHRIQNIESK